MNTKARNRTTLTGQHTTTVVAVRDLTPSAYVLSVERQGLAFTPGQCVILGREGQREQREYSIYSTLSADTLDVLIREVPSGAVSRQLRQCHAGDAVTIEGPVGFFTIEDTDLTRDRFLFVASGTGIAPFHSMVGSYPGLDYQVLHGVRYGAEAYGREQFAPARHVLCTSRDQAGSVTGRVTDYLRANPVAPGTYCLLCGNVKMIDEVYDILEAQGLARDHIRAEVYF